jgi:predicted Rossmann fold flavoprotein
MDIYDVAVVGAGPAGSMAAIRSSQLKKNVIVIERNDVIGKKILLTGNGRCNITNTAPIEIFIKNFGKQGMFLKPAFFAFRNHNLMEFFKAQGLNFTIEDRGRVFPDTNKAFSVVSVLKEYLVRNRVEILYNARVVKLGRKDGLFQLALEGRDHTRICAEKVILAAGGVSYKKTGSSGDGFRIAEALGHTVVDLRPALIPLRIKETWIKQLQGLSLKDVRISIKCGNKNVVSPRGELLFTHFGISGPLVLDVSSTVVSALGDNEKVMLAIDFIPEVSHEQLQAHLLSECTTGRNPQIKSVIRNFLSQRLVSVFMQVLDIEMCKRANQITRKERLLIAGFLKFFPLTVTGSLSIEGAMVTNGGISTKEIHSKTMESRVVPGLYFAGEMIDGCGKSGGYNLQQAFSTGYLAGEKASA